MDMPSFAARNAGPSSAVRRGKFSPVLSEAFVPYVVALSWTFLGQAVRPLRSIRAGLRNCHFWLEGRHTSGSTCVRQRAGSAIKKIERPLQWIFQPWHRGSECQPSSPIQKRAASPSQRTLEYLRGVLLIHMSRGGSELPSCFRNNPTPCLRRPTREGRRFDKRA